MLKEYFNGKQLSYRVNPDEAVAYGATVQAAMLKGIMPNAIKFQDVTPLSLGLEVKSGNMNIIIPRNTKIPCKKTC